MAGAARGARATGHPQAVPDLSQADLPAAVYNGELASMEDLVLPYGYPLETWPVETADGFILRLYRIPRGARNSTSRARGRPVVLLLHGITLASSGFVVLDPGSSMGFYLADAGFDVWVANSRCNSYSAGNREYRSTDAGYWQSSLDELALLDLPATIDAVLRMTGAPQLSVVGHSQGAALPAMLLAARPEYNKKVGLVVMLAPVMFAEELKTKFLTSQARKGGASLLADAGIGHFLPSTMMAHLLQGCMRSHQSKAWCFNLVNFFLFGPSSRVADDDFARLAAAWPSGMPLRVIMHWSQMHRSGRGLEMFDYGSVCDGPSVHGPYQETCNQAKYGQEVPPLYDISRVTTKAAVMYGADDLLGTEANVAKLLANWRADVVFTRKYLNTAHMDFIWARDPRVLKRDLIKVLRDHGPAGARPR